MEFMLTIYSENDLSLTLHKVYKHFRSFLHIYRLPPSLYKMLILFLKTILFPSPICSIIFTSLHCS